MKAEEEQEWNRWKDVLYGHDVTITVYIKYFKVTLMKFANRLGNRVDKEASTGRVSLRWRVAYLGWGLETNTNV